MAQKFFVPVTIKDLSSSGSDAITIYVDNDTHSRLKIEAGGRLTWGSGSAGGDVTLYREGENALKTDDDFKVGGKLSVLGASGDEGGEIILAPAVTNSTLSGDVTIDVYQNKLRIFESSGTTRGAYIDLTAATAGVGSNLLAGGGGATDLDGLSDVTITTPSNGQVLKYNGTAWVNDTDNAGTTINSLDDVSDVTITSAASGDFLKWNGSAWVNDPINLGTDTTGSYVESLVAGTNVTLSNNSGEGATPTIAVSGALTSVDSISSPDYIQFDTTVTTPTTGVGKLQWDPDNGTLQFGLAGGNVNLQLGQEQVALCYNAEATTLQEGEVVYIYGAQGGQISVKRASNSAETTSTKTFGVVTETIAAGATGYVTTHGVVNGLNTSTYTAGDILWLGASAGTVTTTKPSAPNHAVFIGVVLKVNSGGGAIFVKPQNGYELDELHDVSITTPASGQFLKYNGSLWVNDAVDLATDTVGDYVQSLVAGTGITLSNNSGEGATPTVAVNTGTIATVAYVDSVAAGINWHQAVNYASAAALPNSPTYSNGTLGVGATLTGGTNARLVIDGANATTGNRVLVKDQATGTQNGIYDVIDQGSVSTPYILTRSSDTDNSVAGQVKSGDAVFVLGGSTYANQGFVLTSTGTGTGGAHVLGTDILTYTQFTGTANINAGAGLTKTGNTLDIATANTSRIVINDDSIDLATVSQTDTTGSAGTSFVQSHTVDSYGRITGTVTASVQDASTTVKGIASFNSATFSATSGAVSVKAGGISNAQLANSATTIGTTAISLGASSTTLAGLTSVASTAFSGDLTGNVTGNVTGDVSGNAGTATKLATARTISLTGDVTGSVSFDGSAAASITATIAANSVALGTDTTGSYVASLVAGTGVTLTNNSGEGATPTIAIGQAVSTNSDVTFNSVTAGGVELGLFSNTITTSSGGLTISPASLTVTIGNDLIVTGNLTVNGTTTTVNSTTISVDDKNIELGSVASPTDTSANGGGITLKGSTDKTFNWLDATDAWTSSEHIDLASGKAYYVNGTQVLSATALGSGVTSSSLTSFGASPTITTPNLTLASVTSPPTTNGAIVWVSTSKKLSVGDGTQSLDFASSTIITNAQTASYTAVLADKDKLIEISNGSANTFTVPPNSSVAYPVGTQLRILQTGAGQTTITPGSGVTINGTPGLKLRAQWSSATLIKRATDSWVAIGDLSA